MKARSALGLALGLGAVLVGCNASDDGEGEQFATQGTSVARSLQSPDQLTIMGSQLVFATASFVGSGDPELDQQYAYWEGQLWRLPLAGGSKKALPQPTGAVTSVAVLGDELLVVTSGYMGVTRVSPSAGTESDFYNDYTHFPDDSEDLPQLGAVAVGPSGVYVTRPESEVMRMELDGSGVTVFAKTFEGGWLESAEQIVVLEDAVFWSTDQQGETGSTYNLYRANVSGDTTPHKIATYPARIAELATDGQRVFVGVVAGQAAQCHLDVVPADGSGAPKELVSGAVVSGTMRYDERFGLLYPDHAAGAVELLPLEALSGESPVTPTALVTGTLPTSIALDESNLWVASYDWESDTVNNGAIRRYALSKLELP